MPEGNESDRIEGKRISCPRCGCFHWRYVGDHDYEDWIDAVYECTRCGYHKHIELPE